VAKPEPSVREAASGNEAIHVEETPKVELIEFAHTDKKRSHVRQKETGNGLQAGA
jgi:hypothetical protein